MTLWQELINTLEKSLFIQALDNNQNWDQSIRDLFARKGIKLDDVTFLPGHAAPLTEHIAWVHEKIFTIPYLYSYGSKSEEIVRVAHGTQHASRVAFYIPVLANLYRAYGFDEAAQLTNEDLHLIQIAALLHDTGREGDDKDLWDEDSGLLVFYYLLKAGVAVEKAKILAEAVTNKDTKSDEPYKELIYSQSLNKFEWKNGDPRSKNIFQLLIHDADCLDIQRARPHFEADYLDFYLQKAAYDPHALSDMSKLIYELRYFLYQQGDLHLDLITAKKKLYETADALTKHELLLSQGAFSLLKKLYAQGKLLTFGDLKIPLYTYPTFDELLKQSTEIFQIDSSTLCDPYKLLDFLLTKKIDCDTQANPPIPQTQILSLINACFTLILDQATVPPLARAIDRPFDYPKKQTKRVNEKISQARLEAVKANRRDESGLKPKIGNANRSVSLLFEHSIPFASCGYLIFNPEISMLSAIESYDNDSGHGKKKKLAAHILHAAQIFINQEKEHKIKKIADLKLQHKKGGQSRTWDNVTIALHNEGLYHTKKFDSVYFTDDINFACLRSTRKHTHWHPAIPRLSAIFLQDEYQKVYGVQLPIIEYSGMTGTMRMINHFTEAEIYALWSDLLEKFFERVVAENYAGKLRKLSIEQLLFAALEGDFSCQNKELFSPLNNYSSHLKQQIIAQAELLKNKYVKLTDIKIHQSIAQKTLLLLQPLNSNVNHYQKGYKINSDNFLCLYHYGNSFSRTERDELDEIVLMEIDKLNFQEVYLMFEDGFENENKIIDSFKNINTINSYVALFELAKNLRLSQSKKIIQTKIANLIGNELTALLKNIIDEPANFIMKSEHKLKKIFHVINYYQLDAYEPFYAYLKTFDKLLEKTISDSTRSLTSDNFESINYFINNHFLRSLPLANTALKKLLAKLVTLKFDPYTIFSQQDGLISLLARSVKLNFLLNVMPPMTQYRWAIDIIQNFTSLNLLDYYIDALLMAFAEHQLLSADLIDLLIEKPWHNQQPKLLRLEEGWFNTKFFIDQYKHLEKIYAQPFSGSQLIKIKQRLQDAYEILFASPVWSNNKLIAIKRLLTDYKMIKKAGYPVPEILINEIRELAAKCDAPLMEKLQKEKKLYPLLQNLLENSFNANEKEFSSSKIKNQPTFIMPVPQQFELTKQLSVSHSGSSFAQSRYAQLINLGFDKSVIESNAWLQAYHINALTYLIQQKPDSLAPQAALQEVHGLTSQQCEWLIDDFSRAELHVLHYNEMKISLLKQFKEKYGLGVYDFVARPWLQEKHFVLMRDLFERYRDVAYPGPRYLILNLMDNFIIEELSRIAMGVKPEEMHQLASVSLADLLIAFGDKGFNVELLVQHEWLNNAIHSKAIDKLLRLKLDAPTIIEEIKGLQPAELKFVAQGLRRHEIDSVNRHPELLKLLYDYKSYGVGQFVKFDAALFLQHQTWVRNYHIETLRDLVASQHKTMSQALEILKAYPTWDELQRYKAEAGQQEIQSLITSFKF